MRTPLSLLVVAVVGLAALPAEGGPRDRRDRREDRRDDRQDNRQDRREDRREDRQDNRVERRDDRQDEWQTKHKDWVEKRKARREDRRDQLQKTWGDMLGRPAVRAELRKHARRVARIQRVHFLAEANDKPKVAADAKALLEKERARHQARMVAFKAAGSP